MAGPPPGSYDVAVLFRCVQVVGPNEAGQILRNVGQAVSPGGTLYIIGHVVDDTRLAPPVGVWFNFLAISFFEQGQAYSETQYRTWLDGADFGDVEFHWNTPPEVRLVVITARKRG